MHRLFLVIGVQLRHSAVIYSKINRTRGRFAWGLISRSCHRATPSQLSAERHNVTVLTYVTTPYVSDVTDTTARMLYLLPITCYLLPITCYLLPVTYYL